jgi:hypothetical protein
MLDLRLWKNGEKPQETTLKVWKIGKQKGKEKTNIRYLG